MDFISLHELHKRVKLALKRGFPDAVWITAEIASVQENRSGHCYLELSDIPEGGDRPVAVAKATIWANMYAMLKPYFRTTTGRNLEKGMKVLLRVEVVFHELYGYSLNVRDIDPVFTIGDLERKKREILERLEKEGVIHMNRDLEMPELPKTIAVISSPTAAGLEDFTNQLQRNAYGYRFHVKLFPAVMQGDKTTDSIVSALERIYACESIFDVVVIIRGGGSQTELSAFDSYDLAAHVAQFPLPVIAGIGHDRDESVVDRVAHLSVKTPTAAAVFLIESFHEAEQALEELKDTFISGIQELLQEEYNRQLVALTDFKRLTTSMLENNTTRLKLLSHKLQYATGIYIRKRSETFADIKHKIDSKTTLLFNNQRNALAAHGSALRRQAGVLFERHRHLLELTATKLTYADPEQVLKRGYSITRINGKAVKSAEELKPGDVVETNLAHGKFRSIVEK